MEIWGKICLHEGLHGGIHLLGLLQCKTCLIWIKFSSSHLLSHHLLTTLHTSCHTCCLHSSKPQRGLRALDSPNPPCAQPPFWESNSCPPLKSSSLTPRSPTIHSIASLAPPMFPSPSLRSPFSETGALPIHQILSDDPPLTLLLDQQVIAFFKFSLLVIKDQHLLP